MSKKHKVEKPEVQPEKLEVVQRFTPESRPFLNVDEAAALVGLKPPTLRLAIRQGQLAYSRPGRAYLVQPVDLLAWLTSQKRIGGLPCSN